jgi:hypothetical protein
MGTNLDRMTIQIIVVTVFARIFFFRLLAVRFAYQVPTLLR